MPLVKDYYHDIDLHANQLFNSRLHNISTAARILLGGSLGLGDKGYMVYDTDNLTPYFWDGVAWQQTGGSATWGSITGTLTSQTDLTAYLSTNYYPLSSNPANYLTSTAASLLYYPLSSNPAGYLTSATAALTYEPIITAGTTSQYWRGDKTWQTFPTIPTVGTWGALNYPTWISGTPFVKMTAVGTFALDTNTYLTSAVTSVATSAPITGGTITGTGTIGITQSSGSADGYLSSTNWTTFNNKFDLPALTAGSVLFSNGTTIAQDNVNFFWDDTNNRLGIGTATPAYKLDVNGTAGSVAAYINGNITVTNGGTGTNTINAQTNSFSAIDNKFSGHITRDASWSQGDIINLSGNAPVNDAQGWNPILLNTGTVARSSGTATSTMINLQPTYNYTGTYSGITRGIYYGPTLTSLNSAAHRAWENTSGDIVFGNLATGGADEMVTVDTSGKLKKQTIPTVSSVGFEMNFLLMGA
jgi:hypothetical protein